MSYFLPFVEVHAVDHCNHTCRWCHNYSPHSPQKEYAAEEYFEGLDILVENKIFFNLLSLMGGEPFLHTDIVEFADTLIQRYLRPLVLTTNGFWLNEENIHIFKDLWPRLTLLKISRYPSIEKRLGGEENILPLFKLISKYNPKLEIEWPDKYKFNELKFFEKAKKVELVCGNATCLALVNSAKGPMLGRCGTGAYAHLAPKGLLPEKFLASRDMFYELRNYDEASFINWHMTYPLDACSYCNFSQNDREVAWKAAIGKGLFNKEYEESFEARQCLYLCATNNQELLDKKVKRLLTEDKAYSNLVNKLAVYCYKNGEVDKAKVLLKTALEFDLGNAEVKDNLKYLQNLKK